MCGLYNDDVIIRIKNLKSSVNYDAKAGNVNLSVNFFVDWKQCLVSFFFFFFLKFLADTCPFLGPLVPLFWISGDISSGFQSQSGFCLIRYFCGGECNVHSPRFTSGATLADLLVAGAQPVTSPHACAEVGLGSDSNVQPHEQMTNALPLCQRPGLTMFGFFYEKNYPVSIYNLITHFSKDFIVP